MKKSAFVLVAVALLFAAALSLSAVEPAAPEKAPAAAAAAGQPTAALPLTSQTDKISYSLGLNGARSLKHQGVDIAPAAFLRGVSDGLSDAKPLMSEQDMADAMTQLRKIMAEKMDKAAAASGADGLKRGQAFLVENAKKEGVVTLPSGLQYKVITPGDGPSPTANDSVTVNYRGTLVDGTEFDSSAAHGGPANFRVGGVIKGWQEGIKLMKKGAKWQLFVPSDLAYGVDGQPPAIGPNEALVFDVELVDIKRATGGAQ